MSPEKSIGLLSRHPSRELCEAFCSSLQTVTGERFSYRSMAALAKSASDEEVAARANQLANENAEYIKRIASEKLAEIDNAVSAYIEESGLEQAANHHPGEAALPIVLLCAVLVFVCSFIGYRVVKRKAKRV